jgi:hypothetical protein
VCCVRCSLSFERKGNFRLQTRVFPSPTFHVFDKTFHFYFHLKVVMKQFESFVIYQELMGSPKSIIIIFLIKILKSALLRRKAEISIDERCCVSKIISWKQRKRIYNYHYSFCIHFPSMHLIKQSVRDDATGLFVQIKKFILFCYVKITKLICNSNVAVLMAVLCHYSWGCWRNWCW